MLAFIIRRLLILPITLVGLSLLIFAMLQALDPAERAILYVSGPPKTEGALQAIIQKYGLNDPIPVQYWNWITNVAHGNLGWSRTAQQPVLEAIGNYFPATL